MQSMCSYIPHTGHDPPRETPTWDTGECCLRVAVYRAPPYVDFAGGDIFPDLDAEVYHICGSIVEALKILTAAVNCSCMRAYTAPAKYALEGEEAIRFYDVFDLRVLNQFHPEPELFHVQEFHYPLGSYSSASILGKENVTPAQGVKILALFQPAVWAFYWSSIVALTLIFSIIIRKSRDSGHPGFQTLCEFLDVLGISWNQCFGWSSIKGLFRALKIKTLIIGIWSLLSAIFLTKAATADLLELLMYQPGTDRFTSLENLVHRATNDLHVLIFDKSPLSQAIEANSTLVPNHKILNNAEDCQNNIVNYLEQLVVNKAVIVGMGAALTYIKSVAVDILGFEAYRDAMYVHEDPAYPQIPYYVKTSRHWPRVKLAQWRRATAVVLESGISEFAYQRSLAESIPDVLRQAAKERDEHAHILTASVIRFQSIWTILMVCLAHCALAGVIVLIEHNTHYATVYPYQ